jgi:aminodeoxyfutalosine synthase
VFEDFKAAGVGSLPGGGAEVLVERVRREIYPKKITAESWLSVIRTAHQHGFRSTPPCSTGTWRPWRSGSSNLCRLRALQDETGGFMCFIPLAFHPQNTELAHLPGPTGFDDLLTIAVARLMLDNFDHVKAYWIMISPGWRRPPSPWARTTSTARSSRKRSCTWRGRRRRWGLTVERLLRLVRDAGCEPVQRDSVYNVLQRFDAAAVA